MLDVCCPVILNAVIALAVFNVRTVAEAEDSSEFGTRLPSPIAVTLYMYEVLELNPEIATLVPVTPV